MLEFGYAFVEEDRRGNGDGRDLMIAAMEALGKRAAFATARVTNDRITKILGLNNFEIVGREYPSDDDSSRLLRLFVRPASSHAALETQE
jgi:predicted GNAT family N-acyltransferase